MISNADSDTDKLVFTYNNDKSQLHVISQQSCHYSRYRLLLWCRIHLVKYIHNARHFYHSRNSSCHSSDAISNVNSVTRSKVNVYIAQHVRRESSGHLTHVHQLMAMCTYRSYHSLTCVSAVCDLPRTIDIFLMRLVLQQLPGIHHRITVTSAALIWSLTIMVWLMWLWHSPW